MTVGVLRIELAIQEARSLKDKRRVVKSLKDRLANRFHVSVAEVDDLDLWQKAVIGVAMVANDGQFVQSCLDKIVGWVRVQRGVTLVDFEHQAY